MEADAGQLIRCFSVGGLSPVDLGVVEILQVQPFALSVFNKMRGAMLKEHREGEGGPEKNKQPKKQTEKTHSQALRVAQKCFSRNWVF